MSYHSLNTDQTGERLVEPYAIYFDPDGATLKLVAYDHTRREPRLFSVDHIHAVRLTDERFKRPPDFDLRRYLTDNCFNGIYGPPVTVVLRARGVTARVFAERIFHPSQRVVASTARVPGRPETTTIELRVAGHLPSARRSPMPSAKPSNNTPTRPAENFRRQLRKETTLPMFVLGFSSKL
jgi:hypothetical protein